MQKEAGMMKMQDIEKTIPNAGELHMIEYIGCLDMQIYKGGPILEDRLKKIPNGWRDFRLVSSVLEKLVGKIYETLPDKTMRHILHLTDKGEVVIRPKPMVKLQEKTQFLTDEDLNMLVNTAISAECAMCVRDGREQKKCKLRRTLENVAPTEAVHEKGLCAYVHVAAGNPLGDYVR